MDPSNLQQSSQQSVLVASVVSVELGVTVALLELTFGVVAGNAFHLQSQEWLDFIASFASIVLTFLAGMEVDPDYMRDRGDVDRRDRGRVLRRPVRGRVAGRVRRARLVGPRVADRGNRAVHDVARGRLRRAAWSAG